MYFPAWRRVIPLSCQVLDLGSFAGAASGEETSSDPGGACWVSEGVTLGLFSEGSEEVGDNCADVGVAVLLVKPGDASLCPCSLGSPHPVNKQQDLIYCNWGLYGYTPDLMWHPCIYCIFFYQTIIRLAGSIQPKHRSFSHRTACEIKFLFTGLRTPSIDDKYMEGQKVVSLYIYNIL